MNEPFQPVPVPQPPPRPSLLKWNGEIPAWGLLLVGASCVLYGWTWVNDIDRRLQRREDSSAQYRAFVDELRRDQSRLVQVEVKLSRIETVLDRLERKLDGAPRL